MNNAACSICGKFGTYAKGLCRTCYHREQAQRLYHKNPIPQKMNSKRYLERHPEIKAKLIEKIQKFHDNNLKKETCDILRKHAETLKNDPERLTTKFLQSLIGIKCRKVN